MEAPRVAIGRVAFSQAHSSNRKMKCGRGDNFEGVQLRGRQGFGKPRHAGFLLIATLGFCEKRNSQDESVENWWNNNEDVGIRIRIEVIIRGWGFDICVRVGRKTSHLPMEIFNN